MKSGQTIKQITVSVFSLFQIPVNNPSFRIGNGGFLRALDRNRSFCINIRVKFIDTNRKAIYKNLEMNWTSQTGKRTDFGTMSIGRHLSFRSSRKLSINKLLRKGGSSPVLYGPKTVIKLGSLIRIPRAFLSR